METTQPRKAGIGAYIALIFAIIFFSGLSVSQPAKDLGSSIASSLNVSEKKVHDIFSVFDFNTMNGKLGAVIVPDSKGENGMGKGNFTGKDGAGARDGFMFALTLVPTVLFALGMIAVLEHYGALEAMRRLLTGILRPVLGIPGEAGLALIASLQSTDAGAALTRALHDEGKITTKEREVFAMFQFSAGATITNFLGSGAAIMGLTAVIDGETKGVPATIGMCFAVMFVLKIFGANVMRLYLNAAERKSGEQS